MDKYTVDLDQVLNDFEYSELTDNHHDFDGSPRPNNRRPSGPHQNSPSGYLPNNFKNTNVKHSINNVFHSLNEYLNTEIAPKVHNNRTPDNEGTSLIDNVPEKPPEILEKVPKLVEVEAEDEDEDSEDDSEEEINAEETVEENESAPVLERDSDLKVPEEVSSPHQVAFVESVIEEEAVVVATGNADVDDSTEEKYASAESVEILVNEEPIEEPVEENVENQEIEVPQVEESLISKPSEVGFDDLDLDEGELNKYLDDLEREFESQQLQEETVKEEQPKSLNEELEESLSIEQNHRNHEKTDDDNNDDDVEIIKEEVAENIPKVIIEEVTKEEDSKVVEETSTVNHRPNNLALVDKEDSAKPVIDLIGNPGSTPYNNVYVNKELPKNNSDTECSTSASPTFSDVSTETTSSMTPSTDTVNDDNNETTEALPTTTEALATTTEPEPDEGGGGEETNQVGEGAVTLATDQQRDGLGKEAPLWMPDADATNCLHCEMKFTVLKRRHHCRACGYVLCSRCCNLRHRLDYLDEVARVCNRCHDVLTSRDTPNSDGDSPGPQRRPNPNRPSEYCSTVPPHQQASANAAPPSVMVPVGVLKRNGSNNKTRSNKSVMFCDGIRPGSDLTNLDTDFGYKDREERSQKQRRERDEESAPPPTPVKLVYKDRPQIDPVTGSYIPNGEGLPPTVTVNKTDMSFAECANTEELVETLKSQVVIFALQLNLTVHVSIINMDCCINKSAWCFTTEGLIDVGQDEIVLLIEVLDDEKSVPKDVFLHLNNIYADAVKGTSVKEMGLSLHNASNFLGSKNHAGFLYIRPTFQCLQNVIKPTEPYLIGILIHRWETPWAKLFPLRLILRLGAEYRYYPSPIISNRYRDSVFVEIGHTIINLLADFRNFSYTLPQIRGLTIHMEEKNTTVTIPSNRYDQVMKSMNNSSDHILAFAGNFSEKADSHLVCIQDTRTTDNAYSTHAINIHNKPRKVTGASFVVFNGALKSSSGLTAKSSIVEDGLMIQIPAEHMVQIREKLRNMKDHSIRCGCVNAASDETVDVVWGEPDVDFNVNVTSPVDARSMSGVPSIRVHNGRDYVCGGGTRLIRWTEVFIIQNADENGRNQDPVDISKVSESIAKATCAALVKYLDLLVSNNFHKIGIRTTLHVENVSYSAGSNAMKLPPIYMKSLDNELIPVLHRITSNNFSDNAIILELIFRILNK